LSIGGQCAYSCISARICTLTPFSSIGSEPPKPLPYGDIQEFQLPPGELDLGLWFADKTGTSKRLQAGMIAQGGDNFTAIVHPSEERADRPSFYRADAREARSAVQEQDAAKEQ